MPDCIKSEEPPEGVSFWGFVCFIWKHPIVCLLAL
nr:MAG TPA: hypothetical protein [Caudoviricetes sp.]